MPYVSLWRFRQNKSNKTCQKNDLTTDQWKQIFDKVSKYCVWTIVEEHQNSHSVINGLPFAYVPNGYHNLLVKGDFGKNIFVAQPWNSLELEQYQSQLLYVELDQHVRLFVENHGNEHVFFNIMGESLDRITQGNKVQSFTTESWPIGGSHGAIIDLVFNEPGIYPAVNHDCAAIYTGATAVFVAGDPYGLNVRFIDAGIINFPVPSYAYVLDNPSDAVPPAGLGTIEHPAVNVHGSILMMLHLR